jgi:hypothetical protein
MQLGLKHSRMDLGKRFPEDTIAQFNYLPTLHAQLALGRNDTSKAIEVLQAAAPYELGNVGYALSPIYTRGEAYLAAHQGNEATAEFQKILDHRGIVVNEPIGALAHLGLARAYAMQGDTAKATRRTSMNGRQFSQAPIGFLLGAQVLCSFEIGEEAVAERVGLYPTQFVVGTRWDAFFRYRNLLHPMDLF